MDDLLPALETRVDVDVAPALPGPRGPLTEVLLATLRRDPRSVGLLPAPVLDGLTWEDDDLQLAVYCCYELHYRSFLDVDDGWEWHPGLLQWRGALERRLLDLLRDLTGPVPNVSGDVADELRGAAAGFAGPSLSAFVEREGTLAEVRELAVHRSAYQLKEADPHMWAAPRLSGRPKAALVYIQYEEYGSGIAPEMHASLFADVLRALDLDSAYGAYLDLIPAVTLGTVNLISFLGLHRQWRGALVGHLALFEMTSVSSMRRYSRALARLGRTEACRFYDVHVEADAVHELVALDEMAATLAAADPRLAGDIVFGARAALAVEDLFARHVLDRWASGETSLRGPLEGSPP